MLFRPFAFQVRFVNAIPQRAAIQIGEALVESLQFEFPLSLDDQRLRAND